MDPEFLELLDMLREICGFPFRITSGWRDATIPLRKERKSPAHTTKASPVTSQYPTAFNA